MSCTRIAGGKPAGLPRVRRPLAPGGLSWVRRPFALVFILIALTGVVLVCKGLYVHAKALLGQHLLETSFARGVGAQTSARPWPWSDFTTEARLTARRLGRSEIVLSDAGGEALAFGPALLGGTAIPGDEGTAVIAAHRDTHFRWLRDVRPGDLLDVTRRDGGTATFVVRKAWIARADASGIDPDRPGRWIALATCWPFDAAERGPLRYIVEAEATENSAGASEVGMVTSPASLANGNQATVALR